ncbi:Uncharacterised protein [Mycobacteroides abscessus subsp. abscessus]|nr:Uncharacterised protein [Mycobacteroides abscessus subsp. abscessus]
MLSTTRRAMASPASAMSTTRTAAISQRSRRFLGFEFSDSVVSLSDSSSAGSGSFNAR